MNYYFVLNIGQQYRLKIGCCFFLFPVGNCFLTSQHKRFKERKEERKKRNSCAFLHLNYCKINQVYMFTEKMFGTKNKYDYGGPEPLSK